MIARRGLMIAAALGLAVPPAMAQPHPADPGNLLAYLMEDCCNGKPELCRPVIAAVTCDC